MRGQGCFPTNITMRRVLVAVLSALLPLAALVSFAGEALAADPVKIELEHWGNGGTPQSVAKWRNGNLHWTNSHYQEGDADATRLIFDNLPPGAYQVTFTYMAAKKQAKIVKHGHDFLTSYTFSEYPSYIPNTATAPIGLPATGYPDPCLPRVQGGGKPPNVCTLGSKPTSVYQIPLDTVGQGVSQRQQAAGVPQYFSMWNGNITNVSSYSYSPSANFKDTTYVTLTLSFTALAQAEGEGVVLAFGGHLAKSTTGQSGWGAGQGAADINGAPYHWAYNLVTADGDKVAQGARNRSIMIRRDGHIQIVKSCVNVDPEDDEYPSNFPFAATNPSSVQQDGLPYSFYLDCDPENGTVEQSTVITGGSGVYTVSESPLPGYAVTAIVCSILDNQGNVTGTKNLTINPSLPVAYPNTVTASFDFNASETIRCVFTNTKPDAYIQLTPLDATNLINQPHAITATVKQNSGNGYVNAPNGTLVTFSLPAGSPPAFFVNATNTCTTTNGQCSVSINSASPADVTIHATTTFSVNGIQLTRATGDGISLDGPDVTKHYITPSPGILTIIKCVVNNNGGTAVPQDFPFFNNGAALSWTVNDGPAIDPTCPTGYTGAVAGFKVQIPLTTNSSGNIIPVNFDVTEGAVANYTLVYPANGHCTGTISTQNQTATCKFVNDDQIQGRMTGGGSVFYNRESALIAGKRERNVRITHGFELHCNLASPNRLEVVWHDGADAFHLETLNSAKCEQISNPPDQENPEADFDTFTGSGVGRVNSQQGRLYRIDFKLSDHGERGTGDTARFEVWDVTNPNNPVLFLSSYGEKFLEFGNHQAHEENK
jgi:hypothetical protein